jgi:hypothetical protein
MHEGFYVAFLLVEATKVKSGPYSGFRGLLSTELASSVERHLLQTAEVQEKDHSR